MKVMHVIPVTQMEKSNMRYLLIKFITFYFFTVGVAQERITGTVTYIASESIYVRFNSTSEISISDTLLFNNNPCLTIVKKSSSSCICNIISNCNIKIDDQVNFIKKDILPKVEENTNENETTRTSIVTYESIPFKTDSVVQTNRFQQRINARASVANYSNLSPFESSDRHRVVSRLSFNVHNISNSKFSLESYANYSHNIIQSNNGNSNRNRMLRIYNLAINYQIDSTSNITVGRKVNRNLASIGAMDGIQYEKRFKNWVTGATIGTRPDFQDFGFNSNLFQYGAYFGNQVSQKNIYSRTTIGFIEQRNGGNIDRRYIHLQTVQNIGRNLHFFGSMEVDAYSIVDGFKSSQLRLTNFYISSRYRFNRKLSLTLAYDNRKRILFFETFKSDIERLLDDDFARQGIRFRVNYRPLSFVFTGLSYSKRFQSNLENKSDNINGFITLRNLLLNNSSFTLRYNENTSNYLKSNIISSTFSFYTFSSKLNTQLYYRLVDYDYFTSEQQTGQVYYGANFNLRISKSVRLGALIEVSKRQENSYYRLNTKLTKRFNK